MSARRWPASASYNVQPGPRPKEGAAGAAEAELAEARQQAIEQQAAVQRQLDRWWQRLCANDPEVVLATLAEAFADNEAPAAPVAVDGA
jgi:hypothetical protein